MNSLSLEKKRESEFAHLTPHGLMSEIPLLVSHLTVNKGERKKSKLLKTIKKSIVVHFGKKSSLQQEARPDFRNL